MYVYMGAQKAYVCVSVCGCNVGAEGRKRGDVSPRRAGKAHVGRCRCIYMSGWMDGRKTEEQRERRGMVNGEW